MKSYVQYLLGLYEAILSEIAEYDPRLYVDSRRDSSRLLSLVESRGLSYLTMDLVDAGKHFDQCLAAERLTKFEIAGFRPFRRRGIIPRLFKGLFQRVFDDSGALRAVPDVACIRFLRQLFYAAKKVKIPCDDSRTWEQVHEFFETDQEVRSPTLNWADDELRIDDLSHLHLGDDTGVDPAPLLQLCSSCDALGEESLSFEPELLEVTQRVADCISALVGRFDASDWRAKHGPGAVADQDHTQFKYDFPTWPAKLDHAFPCAMFGFANYGAWAGWLGEKGSWTLYRDHEPPSKLIAVPKTLKGPRLIASEPVSHQWCQQMIKDFLAHRLRYTPISQSIHFNDQTENQEFARSASHTGSHATIDLSAASDRVSCWLVERIFRRNPTLVEALHACRTRWVVNTIDKKSPQYHKLRKFACMGSACTFPVQSYIFAILAVSCVLFERRIPVSIASIRRISREVRVFGDDIIIPIDSWEVLQGLLGYLGLKVNCKKTFGTGKFRESCGMDAYDGTDVTPVYSMTYPDVSRPESIVSAVMTHNNFAMRGYWRVAAYIKSTVDRLRRFSFPYLPVGSGIFGWYTLWCDYTGHLRRRWNRWLHRLEYRVDCVRTRTTRKPVERDSALHQYFTEAAKPPTRKDERIGVQQRPRVTLTRRWEALNLS
jgi:hypothetical protein